MTIRSSGKMLPRTIETSITARLSTHLSIKSESISRYLEMQTPLMELQRSAIFRLVEQIKRSSLVRITETSLSIKPLPDGTLSLEMKAVLLKSKTPWTLIVDLGLRGSTPSGSGCSITSSLDLPVSSETSMTTRSKLMPRLSGRRLPKGLHLSEDCLDLVADSRIPLWVDAVPLPHRE